MVKKIEELEKKIQQLEKINKVLMEKVEDSIQSKPNAYNLFETNVLLSKQVDIRTTELNQLAQNYEQEKNKLSHILRSTPGSILIINPNYTVKEYYRGVEFPDIKIQSDTQLENYFGVGFTQLIEKEISNLGQDSKVCYFDFDYDLKENGHKYFQIGLSNLNSKLFVLSMQDITRRTENELKIREQETQIIESSRLSSLGEMAAGIAHEIRNPLAIISVCASKIKRLADSDSLDNEKLINLSEKTNKTCLRITKIIEGLKKFSRDGSNDPLIAYPLCDILEDTRNLCQERMKNSNISVIFPDVEEGHQVKCQPTQLSQVLINLLNNSYDAIEGKDEEKWIKLTISHEDKYTVLSVIDSGTGVSQEVQDKIMQPFFTTKEIGRGTGLGLSISKGIIESMGGELNLDTFNPHTKFDISLLNS